jgi:NADH-quinone oxidoreductase subunit B
VFDTYAVVQGIDRFMPVDMYVPGCPPRPEQLIQSIIDLQDIIQRGGTIKGREFEAPERQGPKRALIEVPPVAIVDSSRNPVIQEAMESKSVGVQ